MHHRSIIAAWLAIFVGFTVLFIGALLMILPGPGIPFVIIGLSMLSAEFLWARRLLRKIKKVEHKVETEVKLAEKRVFG